MVGGNQFSEARNVSGNISADLFHICVKSKNNSMVEVKHAQMLRVPKRSNLFVMISRGI